MLFHLADEELNILDTISWGCFGGLRRTDEWCPYGNVYDSVEEINSFHGYDTGDTDPPDGYTDEEANWYENDAACVLLDEDFGYDSFNPSLFDMVKWLIERSPWKSAIYTSLGDWKERKLFAVRAKNCPCDLAVSALMQFRTMGRQPAVIVGLWESMEECAVPEAHKWACCVMLSNSTAYLSWPDGDDALMRMDIEPSSYLSYTKGERVGTRADSDLSLSTVGGYTMSLSGQWGGLKYLGWDCMDTGDVYHVFKDKIEEAASTRVTGLFQTYKLNQVVDYAQFATDTFNSIEELL